MVSEMLFQVIAAKYLTEFFAIKSRIRFRYLQLVNPSQIFDVVWRTGTIRPGGAVSFLPEKNYTVPECLIVEIRFLLPQNVRKKHSFTILKSHKTVRIRNIEFLEPHIIYVGLLDLVTNKNLEPHTLCISLLHLVFKLAKSLFKKVAILPWRCPKVSIIVSIPFAMTLLP